MYLLFNIKNYTLHKKLLYNFKSKMERKENNSILIVNLLI